MTYTFTRSLALLGAGYWGKNLLRNFDELGALHTLCDLHEERLDLYQKQYPQIAVSSHFSHVLENPAIRAVAIASPPFTHFKLAREALLAGKDVYVEKPLCISSTEAKELVALAEERGAILMVGHLLHYHPCFQKLQELVRSGQIGQLHYIAANRLNLGNIYREENALWNFAPHDISMILSLNPGALPSQVTCTGGAYVSPGVADLSLTSLRFASGLQAHIYVSWLNPFKEHRMVVIGSEGLLVFDDTQPWTQKLSWIKQPIKWIDGQRPAIGNSKPEYVECLQKEPLKEECRHFLTCCLTRQRPQTDGAEGVRVVQVLEMAQRSLDAGGAVQTAIHQPDYQAHPTATVDPGAKIGAGTKIWHYTHVMPNSEIGKNCSIGQNVVISPEVKLGDNVKVQNNVSLYTGVTCEDEVFIGPSAVFTNIPNPRGAICRKHLYQSTHIRKGATIGANATILCGIELGSYCFVGAGALVTRSVKPYALVLGQPARQVGWMSRRGEKLDLPVALPHAERATATCPETSERYELRGDQLHLLEAESSHSLAST